MVTTKSLPFHSAGSLARATTEFGSPVSYSLSCLLARFFDGNSPKMDIILEKTPEKPGKFNFEELEVRTEITGKGSIKLVWNR
jgi:hypothetical protein